MDVLVKLPRATLLEIKQRMETADLQLFLIAGSCQVTPGIRWISVVITATIDIIHS